jgi:hypothetical protein
VALHHEVRFLLVGHIKERLGAAGSAFAGRVVRARRESGVVPEQHRILGGVELVI